MASIYFHSVAEDHQGLYHRGVGNAVEVARVPFVGEDILIGGVQYKVSRVVHVRPSREFREDEEIEIILPNGETVSRRVSDPVIDSAKSHDDIDALIFGYIPDPDSITPS